MSDLFRSIASNNLPPPFPLPVPRSFKAISDIKPLPWNLCFDHHEMINLDRGVFSVYFSLRHKTGPTILMIHGASYSATSFALLARYIAPFVNVVAFDQRCHGLTNAELSFDINDLVMDCEALIAHFKLEKIVFIGHSMGAGIACRVANRAPDKVAGLIVIDICGNTALQNLVFMKEILENRPKSFPTYPKFIDYCIQSRISRNVKSLQFSAQNWVKNGENIPASETDDLTNLTWITPMQASESSWEGWFKTLSDDFINSPTNARALILVNQDTMDREMIIAHMSGQLQLEIVPNSCHSIHEDHPDKIARIVLRFLEYHLLIEIDEDAKDSSGNIIIDSDLQ